VRDEELAKRLVVRRGLDGKCTYDETAKRELIEICLRRGTSIARVARDYGVNANQLHNWVGLYRKAQGNLLTSAETETSREVGLAFIPVIAAPPPELPSDLRLDITLDNGIQTDLRCLSRDDVLAILPVLASLPCSASTRR
jgi:transposase